WRPAPSRSSTWRGCARAVGHELPPVAALARPPERRPSRPGGRGRGGDPPDAGRFHDHRGAAHARAPGGTGPRGGQPDPELASSDRPCGRCGGLGRWRGALGLAALSPHRRGVQGGGRIVGRGPDLGRGLAAPARRAALRTGSAGLSMSGRLFRTLTPLGWLATVAAVALLLLVVGRGAGLRWDPLQLQARRLETA